jgi:ribosomal-protein-alanine N-acetyltransferase
MLWAITLKGKDQLIGTVLLWNIIKQERKAEIGYELNPLYQGKGVMQEALDIVIQYGLKSMELKIIEAYTHKYNQRSIKLLQRKGFTRDMEAESRVGNSELGEKIIFTLINSTQL